MTVAPRMMSASPSFCLDCRVRHQRYGLGIVDDINRQHLTIEFDTGQTHVLLANELQRVVWKENEQVRIRRTGLIGLVTHVSLSREIWQYNVKLLKDGSIHNLPEGGLEDVTVCISPDERLACQQFDTPQAFYLRTMGHYLAYSMQRLIQTGTAARIEPRPHQIFVARRVVNAPRQRFLLADEVGLGKTIEAGLILQELRARGALERVLIVVPTNLTLQWYRELRDKFNEEFALAEVDLVRNRLSRQARENIWSTKRNIICSHSYIIRHAEVWNDIMSVPWDMVIFDEAHHIRRKLTSDNRPEETKLYTFASQISERTRSLLFLTATPLQLHTFELFSLVELLDCALFHSYDYFEQQRGQQSHLNELVRQVQTFDDLSQAQRATLTSKVKSLIGSRSDLLAQLPQSHVAREQVVELLAEQHMLSEVMIRNRKRVMGTFQPRQAHIIPVNLSPVERQLYDLLAEYVRTAYKRLEKRTQRFGGFVLVGYQRRLTSSLEAFRQSIKRRLEKVHAQRVGAVAEPVGCDEEDIDEMLQHYDEYGVWGSSKQEISYLHAMDKLARTIRQDSKYAALEQVLTHIFQQRGGEQVVIFTQFTDTLIYLERMLRLRWPVATFHGSMDLKAKDTAIEQFRTGQARLLISTEAGGEGRNLQFCSTLINYDLPWNPMKVEQRIGRIDRIGQKREVHIYNFSLRGTVEDRVLELLHARIRIFEETVGGLDPILGEMEQRLHAIVLESHPDQMPHNLETYARQLEVHVARARKAEEALRDFIVDLRSYQQRMSDAFDVNEQERLIHHADQWSVLLLRHTRAELRRIADDTYAVTIGKHSSLALPAGKSYTITFNHQRALENEAVEFGSLGHPLFHALRDYCLGEGFTGGYTACRTVVSQQHAGFRGFQFNFLLTIQSLHTTRVVVPVALDHQGHHHPKLRDILLDHTDWNTPQQPFDPGAYPDWEAMVERCTMKAEDVIAHTARQHEQRLRLQRQQSYAAERKKVERYCAYRNQEAQRKLQHDEQVLHRLKTSPRPQDQRVIPIWQHNVENARAYLKTLDQEARRMIQQLEQQLEISFTYELLNVAWVVIVAPAPRGAHVPQGSTVKRL